MESISTALHPLCLMTRMDNSIHTLFHSFFFVEYTVSKTDNSNSDGNDVNSNSTGGLQPLHIKIDIVSKVPSHNSNYNYIEEGLVGYLHDACTKCYHLSKKTAVNLSDREAFGMFVLTISDAVGSRYFVTWKGLHNKIFVSLSQFCIPSFTRKVFELLELEKDDEIHSILLHICEMPIFPGPKLHYVVQFTYGEAELSFSNNSQAIDEDLDSIVLNLCTPEMLVYAWESIIMERKVLVISSNASVLQPVCNFIRQLALPLAYVNTFVPCLPKEAITMVEAPVPYLLGAETSIIIDNGVDLTDTVVIDLDRRLVTVGNQVIEQTAITPPSFMISLLLSEVSSVVINSLSHIINRPRNHDSNVNTMKRLDLVSKTFIDVNLSLISARVCTLRAFYRRAPDVAEKQDYRRYSDHMFHRKNHSSPSGFQKKGSIAYGYMKLLKESGFDETSNNLLSCWIEMDDIVFTVYEFADELPLLYLQTSDIETVSPSPIEPENHVFELTVKKQSSNKGTFRFAVIDPPSRREWINFIETNMKSNKLLRGSTGSSPNHRSYRDSLKLEAASNKKEEDVTPIDTNKAGSSILTSKLLNISMHDTSVMGFHKLKHQHHHRSDSSSSTGAISIDATHEDIYGDDQQLLTEFRSYFMKTQTVSFLQSQLEFGDFDKVFHAFKSDIKDYSALVLNPSIERYIWKGENVCSFISRAVATGDNDSSDDAKKGVYESILSSLSLTATAGNSNDSEDYPTMSSDANEGATVSRITVANGHDSSSSERNGANKLGGVFSWFRKGKNTQCVAKDPAGTNAAGGSDSSASQSDGTNEYRKKTREEEEVDEKYRLFKSLLRHVASSHRKCESELTLKVVDGRMTVMGDLLRSKGKLLIAVPALLSARIDTGKCATDEMRRCSMSLWYDKVWGNILNDKASHSSDAELAYQNRVRLHYLDVLRNIDRGSATGSTLEPVISVLSGYLYYNANMIDEAIREYSKSMCLFETSHMMKCVTQKFMETVNLTSGTSEYDSVPDSYDIKKFLKWGFAISDTVGLQSYRLYMQLCHNHISTILSETAADSDTSLSLRSQRELPSTTRHDLLQGLFDSGLATEAEPNFTYTNKSGSSEVLNESVLCTNVSLSAVELSIQLLTFLRELLHTKFNATNSFIKRIPISQDMSLFTEVLSSSAFKSFELQICQLQKVELRTLSVNERIVFFTNVYNTLSVHASVKSYPGNGLYDRQVFMRSAKYNVGGSIFSMLDIEHGVLRASSSKPMVFGPFTAAMGFKDRDPRKYLALNIPKPFLTFVLFNSCPSSPSVRILREPKELDHELEKYASKYIEEMVRLDMDKKIVYLPELFRIYWKDFGGSRNEVIRKLYKYGPKSFSNNLKEMADKGIKPNIVFDVLDWSPMLIL